MAAGNRSRKKIGNVAQFTAKADGRRLAVDMLIEMQELGLDELAIDNADEYREGRPQSDILVRYLRAIRGQPAVEAGFLAVLTDVIGSACDEDVAAIKLYEREANG
jgi:hypothetical protein